MKQITPLTALHDALAPDMAAVNDMILTHLGSDVPMAQDIAKNLIESGGKRIRPLLTLAFGKIFAADDEKVRTMAAAVEFIHSATLLHDDVVDESDKRRGHATANATFGNAAPVLVGDFLFARAFELMVKADSISALDLLARTSGQIAEGEVLQLSVKGNMSSGIDVYNKIIEAKTAVLFAASTEVPAVLSAQYGRHARDYGLHLGLAFQIMDDVLDYTAEAPKLGKSLGDDFREGKMTLPVWLAYEGGSDEEKDFWTRTFVKKEQNDSDLATAMRYLRAHNVFDHARDVAYSHADKAIAALKQCPAHSLQTNLTNLVQFVVERDY